MPSDDPIEPGRNVYLRVQHQPGRGFLFHFFITNFVGTFSYLCHIVHVCACEHVIITTAIVFKFLFFVLIFSTTLFMSNDFQKSQTLSLFQVGEHSIEIIIKDEQLNVTPNFYTYDSSKIKVPQKFSTTTTTQKESKC